MEPTAIYTYLPMGYEETTLIVFGFLFLLFELFFVSYGLLTILGLMALGLGFYHIYQSPYVLNSFKQSIIIGTGLAFLISFSFFVWWLRKDAKKNHRRDFFDLPGKTGEISAVLEKHHSTFRYQLKIHGEIWQAESTFKFDLYDKVEIIKQKEDSLTLEIKPKG